MRSIELFRLLQTHAARINALAVGIYKSEKDPAEALAEAKAEILKVAETIKDAQL